MKLYVAACALHGLRLHVPDTPFSDEQLDTIFRLLISLFRQLEDKSSPHFDLVLNLLQHSARLKCFLIALDLENANALQLELVSTLMEAINVENSDMLEIPALELLSSAIEEADDIQQPLLDALLVKLLPDNARDDNPAAQHLARRVILRSQNALQPYIQKFITRVLDGQPTDSDLVDKTSELVLALYLAAPQVMLPVLPHLAPSLQVVDVERRIEAVDLVASILAQTGAAQLLNDLPALPEAFFRRLEDQDRRVRLRVLSHAKSLVNSASDDAHRHFVATAVSQRLKDFDESVRIQAVFTLCSIAADHPQAVRSAEYETLLSRLRDRRINVRKSVAKEVAKLVRIWSIRWEDGSGPAAHRNLIIDMALGLCTLAASNDVELAYYILDEAFKFGVFPSKLPAPTIAKWWAQAWRSSSQIQRKALVALLRGKCELQRQIQEALNLRQILKSNPSKRAQLLVKSPESKMKKDSDEPSKQLEENDIANTEHLLQKRLEVIASGLRDIPKAEEGLIRLWNSKDKNVFRALGYLSTYGLTFLEALKSAKDLGQCVGSRGIAAEVSSVLSSRLMPNLIPPECLQAALEISTESEEAHSFVLDILHAAPQLFAQSLSPALELLNSDEILVEETAARVLFVAGDYIQSSLSQVRNNGEIESTSRYIDLLPEESMNQLNELCFNGSPSGAKAAVGAVAKLSSKETLEVHFRNLCNQLIRCLSDKALLQSHARILGILKALSMIGRMMPELYADFVGEVHEKLMNEILYMDLSAGEPLSICTCSQISSMEHDSMSKHILEQKSTWGRPSPDIGIKAALLKTFAQSLVPEDPKISPPQATSNVASAFIAELGDLTDVDSAAPQFQCFNWQLDGILWKRRSEAKDNSQEEISDRNLMDTDMFFWEDYSSEERDILEKQAQDRSPDAGWIRLAAATALLRLCRGYDVTGGAMIGNDYITLGLACQDCIPEVRRALIEKIWATTEHFTITRPNPQRAAKAAALYSLYGADIVDQRNVHVAFENLTRWAKSRREMVDISAQNAASSGNSGTLINEMPEFILPFLVYFVAHHPDYDPESIFVDDSPDSPLSLFLRTLQFALEVLIPPPPPGGNTLDIASEIARQSAATLKILRQLKFCDVLSLSGDEQTDDAATSAAHQVCDMALMLAKQLTQRALIGHQLKVGRFPGALTLPKMCFKPRKNLSSSSKRSDGSDLPAGYDRPHLAEPLFSKSFSSSPRLPNKSPIGPKTNKPIRKESHDADQKRKIKEVETEKDLSTDALPGKEIETRQQRNEEDTGATYKALDSETQKDHNEKEPESPSDNQENQNIVNQQQKRRKRSKNAADTEEIGVLKERKALGKTKRQKA